MQSIHESTQAKPISDFTKCIFTGDKQVTILATSGVDKKVKLWAAPAL